uniref:Uncharacterized protein n=1 Tax=Arion vulgaris TaxID=1028688 RepID=A0A0B6ZL32_9EUPU
MILLCAVAVSLVAILVYYLKVVISERSFTVDSTLTRGVVFDFLKTPINLVRIHPKIRKVFDIGTESSYTSFLIEEDMGSLFGRKMFPMTLSTYSDISNLTSSIELTSKSRVAEVVVTLAISDCNNTLSLTEENKMVTPCPSSATINGRITVKSIRVLNVIISRYLVSVWDTTINTALDLLDQESKAYNHKKDS